MGRDTLFHRETPGKTLGSIPKHPTADAVGSPGPWRVGRKSGTGRRYRPDWVAFLGISTYQAVFNQKSAAIGPQQTQFGGAHVWLLPNPSGLNAHYQLASLVRLFGELRSAVSRAPRRKGTI